jgi:cysteine desulfuration protein SufE
LTAALDAIVDELRACDRQERIELLIDLAKQLPPLPDDLAQFKDEAHRVPECASPVFLFVDVDPRGRLALHADAPIEAPTVRGFIAMLVEGLHGARADDVAALPPDLVERSGVAEILGMQRVSGLSGVVRRLKAMVARAAGRPPAPSPGPG